LRDAFVFVQLQFEGRGVEEKATVVSIQGGALKATRLQNFDQL
jgi:hypothetical protein